MSSPLSRRTGRRVRPVLLLFWLAGLFFVAACPPHLGPAPIGPDNSTLPSPEDSVPDEVEDDPTRALHRQAVVVSGPRPGIAVPYPLERIYGVFYDCRRGGRLHRGLDIGGVGPHFGLGTPLRAMVRARITFIGTPESDPGQFGRRDTRPGTVERRGHSLPRSGHHPPYGEVHYHTRDYGSWHAGVTLVMVALDSEIADHQVRYLHLAAVHPELRVGDEVEAGQEVGLMGGTAILFDLPHVHIDIEDEEGRRVDPAPLIGLEADTPRRCRR